MKTIIVLVVFLVACCPLGSVAAPLTQSTVTEIVKEVNLLPAGAAAPAPAQLNTLVKAPDRVRTGAESRTELTALDRTITRIGANTVFSFATAGRVINLESGSILFHAPKGAGGGTIKSGGASAAVLGTTLMVAATADGGFKVIVLEGRGRITLPNGQRVTLNAGQLVFVRPGDGGFSPVLDINLGKLVAGSQLLTGFAKELPSADLIKAAIKKQDAQIEKGRVIDTGISAEQFAESSSLPPQGLGAIDNNSYKTSVHPALTFAQIIQLFGGESPGKGGSTGPGGITVVPIKVDRSSPVGGQK